MRRLVSDPTCTSDDEHIVGDEYHIKAKFGRDIRLRAFVQAIDERRFIQKQLDGRAAQASKERKRIVPAFPKESDILTLPPSNTPLDYFHPDFFNSLPVQIRNRYAKNPLIALPENDEWVMTSPPHRWKGMDDETFMTEYGNAILQKYKFPTPEEIANMADDEDDGDEDPDDNDEEGGDAEARRMAREQL